MAEMGLAADPDLFYPGFSSADPNGDDEAERVLKCTRVVKKPLHYSCLKHEFDQHYSGLFRLHSFYI